MAYDEALADRVRQALAGETDVVEKKMFGGTGYLLRGNMACGVNGSNLIVRVGPDMYQAALDQPGVRIFDMTGRPMAGWVQVASDVLPDEAALLAWVEQGLAYAGSLPPK